MAASLDDELALFESEIASLDETPKEDVAAPPTKKARHHDAGVVVSAPPVINSQKSSVPFVPPSVSKTTKATVPTTSTAQAPQIAAPPMRIGGIIPPFLPPTAPGMMGAGLGLVPPPVPPPMFVPHQMRAPGIHLAPPAMPVNMFMPHQLRVHPPPRQSSSAVIEGAPSIYQTEPVPAVPSQTMQALQKDIDAMEAKKAAEMTQQAIEANRAKNGIGPGKKAKKFIRSGGGQVWEDASLADWDPNDFRIFCGDLGNEVSDELLAKAFRKYPSFQRAKVVRDARSNKSKGYGFVSFTESDDYVRAIREMDGKYVGNRPIKLRKSNWKDRNLDTIKKKQKQKVKLGLI